jgi:hypothetical protein
MNQGEKHMEKRIWIASWLFLIGSGLFIKLDQHDMNVLKFLATQSNKLRNCATYLLRQGFFTFGQILDDPFGLHAGLKTNPQSDFLFTGSATDLHRGDRIFHELQRIVIYVVFS